MNTRASDDENVEAMVVAARLAAPAWAAISVKSRCAIMERFRAELFKRRHEGAAVISRETGKPLPESMIAEVATVLDGARFLERVADKTLRVQTRRSGTLALWRKKIYVHHEPFGVVAIVSPWNYPFLFTALHVLPALVAGNVVLLKPSENTPETADFLADVLRTAGVPHDVFQVVHGEGKAGAALVNANIDKVFFTGSARTGRFIAEACAPRFIPVSLELGSSDAAIVLADANVPHAASGITWGRFTNAGQTCVAPKRAIVLNSVHDQFVALVKQNVEQLHVGDAETVGTDVGRMITVGQAKMLNEQLADAIAKGATVAARHDVPATLTSPAYAPLVVLTDVTTDMRVWTEETFGPILAVVRATSDEDALRQANATPFGLSGSVWSENRERARALALRLDGGAVAINDCVFTAGTPEIPHGGVKESGMGRVHGIEGLLECVHTKTVVDDRLTGMRQAWWFGYGPSNSARVDAYLRLAHGRGLLQRLSGLAGTIQLLIRPERPI
ncbi:MAG: aldehyde dehydrogenase family protein [Gemmatimonadaceae bacterium]